MTTAISLPDALFQTAEKIAQEEGLTRNQLYEAALIQFLNAKKAKQTNNSEISIKEQFDAVYQNESSHLDPVLVEIQARSLTRDDAW